MTGSVLEDLVDHPIDYLHHEDPAIRRLAASACAPRAAELAADLAPLVSDPDALVRAEVVEVLGGAGSPALQLLEGVAFDPDSRVIEALATSYGEIADPSTIDWLEEQALSHEDRMVREAAVAALGAIGDERSLDTLLLAVTTGPPQVRRRAVVALTVFDGPRVEEAIRAAATDRNPMVREAAQMVVGRPLP